MPRPKGASVTIPAPYAGLNLRDDIAALKPNEACQLENWIPESGKLVLRPGFAGHSTGVGSGAVQTLCVQHGPSSSKLVAAGGGAIYNATTAGVATSLVGSQSVNRWQHVNAVNRLFLVNGTDAPRDYDGTTITATAWNGSGLTITNLVNVAHVRNRLWFCENNSADVWYSGIGSVTGTLTKFQLSQIADGGKAMAIGSWSRDAGDGMDDLTVFVMDTGQIIVYQGDPADSFSLVGKYGGTAPPIGRHCLVKVGGELIVITRLGLLPVSAAVAGALDLAAIEPWGKIAPLIADYAVRYAGNDGWSGIVHNGLVYIVVPFSSTIAVLVVLNTRTRAWFTITGWNVGALASYSNNLYFAAQAGGFVRKVTGGDDNTAAIVANARGAFVTPKAGHSFTYTAARPQMKASGDVSGFLGVDTDYSIGPMLGPQSVLSTVAASTLWGSAWGSAWGSENEPFSGWISITGDGRSVGPKLHITADSETVEWFSTDLLMVPGSIK